ncbi:MAG: discoidin domain-containing protein [Candidatus Aminicenantes bacterium]
MNTWIMSWNARKITHLDIQDYFDANIFYPHQRTLAYSEYLLSQTLIALPVLLLSKNPILAYNFVFLFSFVTSGLGMFFLARHLTRTTLGGLVAGIIYSFSPFMIAHLGHLQVITAGGIPLTFLFLHKFCEKEQYRHLFLFTFFFLFQVLANGYYAMYLSLFVSLYLFVYMISKKRWRDGRFWAKMIIAGFTVLVVAGPFFRQYYLVRQEMGFARKNLHYADLTSFLATSPLNRLYGDLTVRFLKQEGELFPGVLPFLLAVFGVAYLAKKKRRNKSIIDNPILIYFFMLTLSFLFTFGPHGPYIFLYKYVPGFDGLRVASRFHIMVMLSLAVLAAFGTKFLFSYLHIKRKVQYFITGCLFLVILTEYFSLPIPLKEVSIKDNIPAVYKWLAAKKDNFAVIELPLPQQQQRIAYVECPRMYYSTYHWKKLVNGCSGYFPPLYDEIKRRWQQDYLEKNIRDLEVLGIKYIIIHSSQYEKKELGALLRKLKGLKKRVQFVAKLGDAHVYRLNVPMKAGRGKVFLDKRSTIARQGWQARSNVKNQKAGFALDGDISTRWDSGPQKKGVFFELDLGAVHQIQGVSLNLGKRSLDYPRGYRVEVSSDKRTWNKVAEQRETYLPITSFLKAKDLCLDITFSPVQARYINIVNTGEHEVYYWSIFEIEVFE